MYQRAIYLYKFRRVKRSEPILNAPDRLPFLEGNNARCSPNRRAPVMNG